MLGTRPELVQPDQAQEAKREAKPLTISENELTIVLPVLNEQAAVKAVIDELRDYGYNKILVVDGYSTDSTAQIARQAGVTVVEQHGRGKTGAIQTAIESVDTPYILVMDGDFTYDPASIPRFLAHVNGYDEIVGVRSKENINRLHRIGNRLISALFNALFGTGISDVCSGMYLLNTKTARDLEFRSKGFSVEVEVLAQMSLHGRVTEVPIHYRKRIGEAKLSTVVHGFDILKSVLGLARRYDPVFLFSLIAGFAAIPAVGILVWVLWIWTNFGVFHGGWTLIGGMLFFFSIQAFIVGTLALLLRRTELRMERLIRGRD